MTVGAPRRVAVTGLGVVSPLGADLGTVLRALQAGASALQPRVWALPEGELQALVGQAVLPDPDPVPPKLQRRIDRFAHLGLAAGLAAWADSREAPAPRGRSGIFMGVGFGGLGTIVRETRTLDERGPRRVSPFFIPGAIANILAGHLAELTGIVGPTLTYANACAAGSTAIGEAFLRIRHGELDVALAGGAESVLDPLGIAGFGALRALASPEHGVRPFADDRRGFALGEGAAVLVLEDYERALARHVRIYAEVVGYGASADAHHVTEPHPAGAGAERAVAHALTQAGMRAGDLDYINAHATGTPAGDAVEAAMLARLLGPCAGRVHVSSTKGLTGHLLGAAGAVEALISILALTTGVLPPNSPCGEPCPEAAALRLVRTAGGRAPLRSALSTSFGFGGVNAALVLKAAELGR